MTSKDWPRLALSAFLILLLGYAAWFHYSPGIEETIKATVLIAVGYWLGSSEGSKEKTAMLAHRPTGEPDDPVATEEV